MKNYKCWGYIKFIETVPMHVAYMPIIIYTWASIFYWNNILDLTLSFVYNFLSVEKWIEVWKSSLILIEVLVYFFSHVNVNVLMNQFSLQCKITLNVGELTVNKYWKDYVTSYYLWLLWQFRTLNGTTCVSVFRSPWNVTDIKDKANSEVTGVFFLLTENWEKYWLSHQCIVT